MYPGGKNGNGVYQTIINEIPRVSTVIELFGGSGSIIRNIGVVPQVNFIYVEKGRETFERFKDVLPTATLLINGDAFEFLEWLKNSPMNTTDTLIFIDPPYLFSERHSKRDIYEHELTQKDHAKLLKYVHELSCKVMLVHYPCAFYNVLLGEDTFRSVDFKNYDRQKRLRMERLYMNYEEPLELITEKFVGHNFRDRYRIKQKAKRWIARLEGLEHHEKRLILKGIKDNF